MTAAPLVNQPSLGELIEQKRESLGLTKSEAARLAGVSRGTWHEVESGKRTNMLANTLNLFDKALGYERGTLRRLSRGDPRPTETPPTTVFLAHSADPDDVLRMQLIRYVMTMTSDDVRTILLMVSARHDANGGQGGGFREQLIELVRATISDGQGEPSSDESGRTNAEGTGTTTDRPRSGDRRTSRPEATSR